VVPAIKHPCFSIPALVLLAMPMFVVFEISTFMLSCLASRDPSTGIRLHGISALEDSAQSSVISGHQSGDTMEVFEDPPKPDTLKEHIAEGGPLEKSIETAVSEATELEQAAKDWSETSRKIDGLSHDVAAQADKSHEDLKRAHGSVQSDAEAGVGVLLRDAAAAMNAGNSSANGSLLSFAALDSPAESSGGDDDKEGDGAAPSEEGDDDKKGDGALEVEEGEEGDEGVEVEGGEEGVEGEDDMEAEEGKEVDGADEVEAEEAMEANAAEEAEETQEDKDVEQAGMKRS